jgi:hypothetical protein
MLFHQSIMNNINIANETITPMLRLFTDPEVLQRLERRRIGLLLDNFTPELREHGVYLTTMHAEFPQTYIDVAAQLADVEKLPARFIEALELLETAAAPGNAARIDEIFARRFPKDAGPFGCALDRVLELWHNAPEELEGFRTGSAGGVIVPQVSQPAVSQASQPARTETAANASELRDVVGFNSSSSSSSISGPASPQNSITPSQPIRVHPPVLRSGDAKDGCESVVENPACDSGEKISVPSCPLVVSEQSQIENESPLTSLLNTLVATLSRFVILPEYAAEALALWILHTYGYELRDVSTYIGIESPTKRCGKSTLLTVLGKITCRSVLASNISSSALFRVIQETRPTLLIDEADTFLQGNEEFRGILNSGYTRETAFVIRVSNEPKDSSNLSSSNGRDDGKPNFGPVPNSTSAQIQNQNSKIENIASGLRQFSVWCPKAIAAIGQLPDTLSDRCITIRMQRKIGTEPCDRVRNLNGSELRSQCEEIIRVHADAIRNAQPNVPRELNDRAADLWEPLLILADLAGGDWPQRARDAALALSASAQEQSPISALLMDLLLLFSQASDQKKFFTRDILDYLNGLISRPWFALTKGKPVTDMWLSAQLRPYGIAPKTLWFNDRSAKGYSPDQFEQVFRRYIPKSEIEAKRVDIREIIRRREATDQNSQAA